MEKQKKRFLIVIVVIFVLISLIAILLSRKENKPPIIPSDKPQAIISKEIIRLDNSNEFFGIQKIINDYYLLLASKNTNELLQLLDTDFKQENNITTNNLYSILKSDYENTSFVAKEIYYNPNSTVTYYFVNGYLIDMKLFENNGSYEANVNYLIIKNKKNYVIRPFDSNANIKDVANTYNIKSISIDNNSSLYFNSVSVENKLTAYINDFKYLLVYDRERAYSLLNDETKKKYDNYDDFKSQYIEIYNMLSSKIFSYKEIEEYNINVYNIVDDNQNRINIQEFNIMDYKIGY